ncbi:tetratricopeptide repeat protein 16-like isoform X2 [Lineus longissimus]|uniref:tetratricopeptide repeat protein 16-like isoform X2 n=1 Tax=Lineus longissimus TaxID=88925 RepID=UPI00315D0BFC
MDTKSKKSGDGKRPESGAKRNNNGTSLNNSSKHGSRQGRPDSGVRRAKGSGTYSSSPKNTDGKTSQLADRSYSTVSNTDNPTDGSKKSDLYTPSTSRTSDHLESRSTNVYSEEFATVSALEKESGGSLLLGLPAGTNDADVNVNQFYPTLEPRLRAMSETDTTRDSEFGLTEEEKLERRMSRASSTNERKPTPDSAAVEAKTVTFESGAEAPETAQLGTDKDKESPGETFSTAVDEEVLEAAKERMKAAQGEKPGGLFLPEQWSPTKATVLSAKEVIKLKANEHYERGIKRFYDGDLEKAVLALNKAINLRTDMADYYISRGEVYVELCDFQSAILNYKKACCLAPTNDELYSKLAFIYFFQGQCLFDQKLYPEALEAFSKAAEMRPEVMGYHTRSIACLAALNRHGECLALVNKRLEEETDNADLFVMRARLHELFRNSTLCSYDVKDALAIEPAHPEALKLLRRLEEKALESKNHAMQLSVLGKHKEALQKISVAIETEPGNPGYHVFRGALHRRLGDFNAAIDDYLLALDKTDHNEESPIYVDAQRQLLLTYNDFAVECFNKGYYEEAIILLNKAIKGEKREKGLYINRGDCFYRQEDLHFALADYHQALEIDPMDNGIRSRISVVHNEFGVAEYQDKDYKEAESRFTLAIQNNPKIGHYYLSRARTRYMLESSNGARSDILFALLLDPHSEELMSLLSRLFPGKSVKDILESRAAQAARLALSNVTVTASPIKLKALQEEGSDEEGSEVQSSFGGKSQAATASASAPEPIIPMWQPDRGLPDFKACLQEWEFNIKVAKEKKVVSTKVKKHFHERKPLKYIGARVQPMPPAVPYQRRGSKFTKEVLVADPSAGKNSTGWKQFGQGIGLPH